ARVQALVDCYRAAGMGAGHRVATLLGNRPDALFHWFALNALGASVVPVNPDYRESELRFLLEHSEASLAVVLPERAEELRAVAAKTDRPAVVASPDEVLNGSLAGRFSCADFTPSRQAEC